MDDGANVLACTDKSDLPLAQLCDSMKDVDKGRDPDRWTPFSPKDEVILEIRRVLKAGGTVHVYKSSEALVTLLDQMRSDFIIKLAMAGFTDIYTTRPSGSLSAGVKAKKRSREISPSSALKKEVKSSPKVKIDVDSDLIDVDSLLTEEDLKKPQLSPVGDCEIGSTRKACKNCTCGRAEEEENVLKLGLTAEQNNNPQSACSSCGLGDAFRCSTCPYKGLPAFKLGEKIAVSGNFLAADI